ncbi:bile acid:sodium symporter family protein [Crocosphaera sp. UHCC 0190]|uniref:bile acid:sodium symporter family protein n=1 Tax=Crocosphaera sp. UHCC 0190 TaxID=3110246 RepID=UPI002B20496A|nr:bile acid:sodium symporter family protein [Crocosphaera sp. UHCC 0190]MEA5511095.1 bile acid:sodium symporter family protein [Crocosphaera sp. UHCC 0190]
MESNFLTAVFLPLALFIIMMGMGLGLKVDDFKRVLVEPKAVILGLIAQLILLPIVGFLLAGIFPLTPELAVGVMILVACPGGATSNMITYLVRGNVAVSITLTAISSLITVFTIPLVVNLAMESFMGGEAALQLPILKTVMQIAVITLIPVSLGMLLNYYTPQFATKVEKTVKWLSLFFLALIIFGLLLKERANVLHSLRQVGGVTLTLNVVTMLIGYGIGTVAKLDDSITKAITVEVGIQNGTLAIAIASTLLNTPSMAIPAGIYSLLMFVTSAVFALWVRNRKVISIQ